ncbi:alpha/beta hydrolase [Antrihabitans sp. YC2-6]|uniref:alpha/beta hydrolase n=1 Tax=Antrihabitans sp. YC2-6 TaxID=2799498 RepID=UPI0018F38739|nr:alpha/beta hydrolase [Antrihabitans sp. YC2-6]MBJ8346006.1 alpha/beta hydrolase [Antrihabitans sp. YC2-6]
MPDRIDVTFESGDDLISAWLYQADRTGPGPAVVLGHGLGAVKEMGLDRYAERFVAAGYTCLVFDYRHFGESGGEPRQLLDIDRQLADWAAAIGYARSLFYVDPDKVAIFGSSFGGGHVIISAARDPRVAAVISQCPFTSGTASALTLGPAIAKVTALAVQDDLARILGRAPVMVPLAGSPGEAALMNSADAVDGFLGLVPEGHYFRNEVAARVGTRIALHHPGRSAKKVQSPILFCVCDTDTVAPAKQTLEYAIQAPRSEIVRYPVGHFDIYVGDAFEKAIADQVAFLERHLPV